MNILYFAHRIPFPPNKGDKLRAFRQLEFLSRSHRVWCACFIDDPKDQRHIARLREYCHELGTIRLRRAGATLRGLHGMARGKTFTESYYGSARMTRLIGQWCTSVQFDAVVAFSSGMAGYALRVPAPRRVLDLCDLDSQKWNDYADSSPLPQSRLYRTEAQRLGAREHAWISQFDAATLITRREIELLPPELRSRVHLVSNGVEVSPRQSPIANHQSSIPIIGFLGQMDYKPNMDAVCWFAHQCWPLVRKQFPSAIFRIVGRRPTRAVRRLAGISGIEVTGEVADAGAAIAKFDVNIAPLHISRGLPNKVLEALAAAKPVVTTSGVAAALEMKNDAQALIADTPSAFAAATIRLLANPDLRTRLGHAGREFVIRNFDWQRELTRLEMIVTGGTRPQNVPEPRASARAMVLVP